MEKLYKNVIIIVGVILCAIVLILNVFCIAKLSATSEKVLISICKLLDVVKYVSIIIIILVVSKIINSRIANFSRKSKIIIISIILVVYALFQILWINIRNATPAWDQYYVYETALKMYEGNFEGVYIEYIQRYPQQLSLAWFWTNLFKIFNTTSIRVIQYTNVFFNTATMVGLLLITNQLSKKYEVNRFRVFLISISFITLPLLSTFIYGDIVSITMNMFAVYFIMEYGEKNKLIYLIISGIFMAIGYITRMNSLIYIIAISIYILLDILKMDRNILKKIIALILFITISSIPATIIKNKFQKELNLNQNGNFAISGFMYIGMETNDVGNNGWFRGEIADWMDNKIEVAEKKYNEAIKDRLKYFAKHPLEALKFYILKITSTWVENTYAGIAQSFSNNFWIFKEDERIQTQEIDMNIEKYYDAVYITQKAIIIMIFGISFITLISCKKSTSNEVLLLVVIFIGGFLFHILWEAKSRYVITYIVALIPMSSIQVQNYASTKLKDIKMKISKT